MANKELVWDADLLSALDRIRENSEPPTESTLFALCDLTRPELEKFAGVWVAMSAERRRQVVRAMADLAEERFEADFNRIFRYLVEDEDPEVREQAIDGLWEDEDALLINPLIGAMRSDADARVRAAAADALGRFLLLAETKRIPSERGNTIYEALLASIRSGVEDPLVRRRAVESIAYRGDETVRDIITSTYADDDPLMRATAIFAMGRTADPYWRHTIGQELYSADPRIQYEAARASGELEYKAAVSRLIELLDDADREVQSASIAALGQIGSKEAREALVALIEGEDDIARELAQDALDELEFVQGSELLLYDMGLADDEDAELEDELEDEDLNLDDGQPDDQDLNV